VSGANDRRNLIGRLPAALKIDVSRKDAKAQREKEAKEERQDSPRIKRIGRMNADKIRKNPRESVESAKSAANRIIITRGTDLPA